MKMKFATPTQSRLQKAIILVALLGSAWYLAGLVALLVSSPQGPAAAPEQLRPLPQQARFDWFPADRPVNQVVAAPVDQELLNASINAELLGVVIQGGQALAAIQLPRTPNGVYRVGDEISPGVILEQIEPLRVVVSERGARRQIPLKALVGGRASDSAQLLETVQSRQPGFSLAGVVAGSPIQVPGRGIGYRLDSLGEEVEEMSGLRSRDVILAIGGYSVTELLSNRAIWDQLSQESNVVLDIQRDGVDQQITVNARSLGERILPTIGQGLVQ